MSDDATKPVSDGTAAVVAPVATPVQSAPAAPVRRSNPYAKPRVVAQPAAEAAPATPAQVAPAKERVTVPAKVAKELDVLRSQAEAGKATLKMVERMSDTAMKDLSEQQRAFVRKIAGKDPVKVLNAIEDMREHGMLTVAPAPVAKPATTGPVSGPAPAAVKGAVELAEYERLLKGGAHARANLYKMQHAAAIESALKARH